MTDYQKDLPTHMLSEALLHKRLRTIFRDVLWCDTLFQRTTAHETPESFAQKLVSAAVNHDRRVSHRPDSSSKPYHSHIPNAPDAENNKTTEAFKDLIAFFAKTPPPPRHRRPKRFQHSAYGKFNRFNGRNQQHNRFPSNLPSRFRSQANGSRKMRCFGFNSPDHLLHNCPNKKKYMERFQHIVDMGTAAAFFLQNEDKEIDDDDVELMT